MTEGLTFAQLVSRVLLVTVTTVNYKTQEMTLILHQT